MNETDKKYPAWISDDEIGRESEPVEFPLERGKIREFAASIRDSNPIYRDLQAAREAGFDDIPVPVTYMQVSRHFTGEKNQFKYPFPYERLLHGEHEVIIHKHPVAGQTLYMSMCLSDAYEKPGSRGGVMKFAVVERRFRDGKGEILVTTRDTLIETGITL